ncbi:MAG: Uma2 family endonuclease [Deltaproteobacteria bacterium]|nr:Uma2 family endonuclease [Deltaproteobacteria bacterium]
MRKGQLKAVGSRGGIVWPTEEDVGERFEQTLILEVLRPLIVAFLLSRKVAAFVGRDQYIFWDPNNPRRSLAPDIYVMPGVSPDVAPASWRTWEDAVVPAFAVEVVGDDVNKDYVDGPKLYNELGVDELVVFDPLVERQPGRRVQWQVHRRLGKRGLVRVFAGNTDRVESRWLKCWLRTVPTPQGLTLRLATGTHGDDLVPTDAERAQAEAERAQAEAERAQAEAERAQAEAGRAQAEAERARSAETELQRLREELAALRRR